MLKHRDIRLSVRDRLRNMLQAPPAGTFQNAWNVYDEVDLRNPDFVPSFPWIYLLDAYIPPVTTRVDLQQPQMVIEIDRYTRMPFEIGNRSGRDIICFVHVFGKNRGERDDLGAFVVDHFGNSVSIKTYSPTNIAGTEVEKALLEDEIIQEDMFTPGRAQMAEDVEVGGLLLGWSRISFRFRPKL